MSLEQVENQDIKMAKTEGGTISRIMTVSGSLSRTSGRERRGRDRGVDRRGEPGWIEAPGHGHDAPFRWSDSGCR
jgi:hypothetical protein